eukprot:scaffold503_cov365-Prasinococcus_capsulatus_cf.AAC.14
MRREPNRGARSPRNDGSTDDDDVAPSGRTTLHDAAGGNLRRLCPRTADSRPGAVRQREVGRSRQARA